MKKLSFSQGFTVIEIVIVLGVLSIIIGAVLVNFNRAKNNVDEDAAVSDLKLVQLALEQYRAQCKVYPEELSLVADNAYPISTSSGSSSATCQISFNDVLTPGIDLSLFDYQALQSLTALPTACSAYHLAVQLDPASSKLLDDTLDDDYGASPDAALRGCGGSVSDTAAWEDGAGWLDVKYP